MIHLFDKDGRPVRLTGERLEHLESDHPEMRGQVARIEQTVREPERVVRSRTDPDVELYYRMYPVTPVTRKYLCVVVKTMPERDAFVVTAYFTDKPKQGDLLWPIQ
jgi:hypothetical protein